MSHYGSKAASHPLHRLSSAAVAAGRGLITVVDWRARHLCLRDEASGLPSPAAYAVSRAPRTTMSSPGHVLPTWNQFAHAEK